MFTTTLPIPALLNHHSLPSPTEFSRATLQCQPVSQHFGMCLENVLFSANTTVGTVRLICHTLRGSVGSFSVQSASGLVGGRTCERAFWTSWPNLGKWIFQNLFDCGLVEGGIVYFKECGGKCSVNMWQEVRGSWRISWSADFGCGEKIGEDRLVKFNLNFKTSKSDLFMNVEVYFHNRQIMLVASTRREGIRFHKRTNVLQDNVIRKSWLLVVGLMKCEMLPVGIPKFWICVCQVW